MVVSCIVINCKNISTNPSCYALKWHRIPAFAYSLHELRRHLQLPELSTEKIKKVRIVVNACAKSLAITLSRHLKESLLK